MPKRPSTPWRSRQAAQQSGKTGPAGATERVAVNCDSVIMIAGADGTLHPAKIVTVGGFATAGADFARDHGADGVTMAVDAPLTDPAVAVADPGDDAETDSEGRAIVAALMDRMIDEHVAKWDAVSARIAAVATGARR